MNVQGVLLMTVTCANFSWISLSLGGPEKKKRSCVQKKYTRLESHIKTYSIHQERNIVLTQKLSVYHSLKFPTIIVKV